MRGSVTLKGRAPAMSFEVDGKPVHASSVTIEADAKGLPVAHIELPFTDADVDLETVNLILTPETRDFLKRHGWKEPE